MGYDFNQQLCLFGLFKISELSSNSIEKLLRVFLTYAKVHPKALFTQFLPEMEVAFENMRK